MKAAANDEKCVNFRLFLFIHAAPRPFLRKRAGGFGFATTVEVTAKTLVVLLLAVIQNGVSP
jgi:hypothetical protein